MILVVLGAGDDAVESVIKEFMTLFPSQCRRLYTPQFASADRRIEYLNRSLIGTGLATETVTLLPQIPTSSEVNMLRARGAYVAHIYGALSAAHSEIEIDRRDYMIKRPLSVKRVPSHVMTVEEVMSDLQYRRRKARREAVA